MAADLMVMDEDGALLHVMCQGQWVVRDSEVMRRGVFENK